MRHAKNCGAGIGKQTFDWQRKWKSHFHSKVFWGDCRLLKLLNNIKFSKYAEFFHLNLTKLCFLLSPLQLLEVLLNKQCRYDLKKQAFSLWASFQILFLHFMILLFQPWVLCINGWSLVMLLESLLLLSHDSISHHDLMDMREVQLFNGLFSNVKSLQGPQVHVVELQILWLSGLNLQTLNNYNYNFVHPIQLLNVCLCSHLGNQLCRHYYQFAVNKNGFKLTWTDTGLVMCKKEQLNIFRISISL